MYRTLLLATALTVGLAGAAVAQEVTIGLTMGTTGPGASLGINYKNAFQLMPKTIGGYPVKFIILEDKSDATEAAKNARQLITEDKSGRADGLGIGAFHDPDRADRRRAEDAAHGAVAGLLCRRRSSNGLSSCRSRRR